MDKQIAVLREAISMLTRSGAPMVELWERAGHGEEVVKRRLLHAPTTLWTDTWTYQPIGRSGWMVRVPHHRGDLGPDTIVVFLSQDAQLLNATIEKPQRDSAWHDEHYANNPGFTMSRRRYVYAIRPPAEFAVIDRERLCPFHGEYHQRWDRNASSLSKGLATNFV